MPAIPVLQRTHRKTTGQQARPARLVGGRGRREDHACITRETDPGLDEQALQARTAPVVSDRGTSQLHYRRARGQAQPLAGIVLSLQVMLQHPIGDQLAAPFEPQNPAATAQQAQEEGLLLGLDGMHAHPADGVPVQRVDGIDIGRTEQAPDKPAGPIDRRQRHGEQRDAHEAG